MISQDDINPFIVVIIRHSHESLEVFHTIMYEIMSLLSDFFYGAIDLFFLF
jgi:hypothetical protein